MKTALVTGASRGIGAAVARALKRDGFMVYINFFKSAKAAKALADEIGAVALFADVSDIRQVREMFKVAGNVDVLINNAGISQNALFTDTSAEIWREIFAINVDGVYNCIQCALPHMLSRKDGVIINMSSVWGLSGASCESAYSASKAALIGLTKSLAKELGPSGIRVNCIAPGVIETDMLSDFCTEDISALRRETPLLRLGTPSDVAELTAFLASDRASFITGQVIGIDGGFAL